MTINRLKYNLYAWLSCCVALLMVASCSSDDEANAERGMGYITFGGVNISAEIGGDTRAAFSVPVPDAADLNIEVIDKDNAVVESDTYGNLSGKSILVPLGTYTIRAYYGTKSAIGSAPYFEGSTTHTVQDMSVADANTVAEVSANLQSSVVIPSIPASSHFSKLKCVVDCGSETKSLDNDEVAYILPGYTYNVSYVGVNSYGRTITTTVLSGYQPTAAKPEVHNLSFTLKLTLPDQSAGAWAKRFYVTPIKTLDANNETVELNGVTYQISTDNSTWSNISSKDAGYYCATNLTANTKYYVRAVMDDIYSDVKEITTEKEEQITNGDMESWSSTTLYSQAIDQTASILCYYFGNSTDSEWATRNTLTTSGASEATIWSPYNYAVYWRWHSNTRPITDDGRSVAEISNMAFYNSTVSVTTARKSNVLSKVQGDGTIRSGFLCTGTYDNNDETGNIVGIAHPSRPKSISIDYKFKYRDSNGQTYAILYDSNRNKIAETDVFQITDTNDSYTTKSLSFTYSSTLTKAVYIGIMFKSSENNDAGCNIKNTVISEIDGSYSSSPAPYTRVVGSQLYIDNVKLIYE